MAITLTPMFVFFSLIISLFLASSADETCSNYTFSSNKVYTSCTDLPYLQAHLHWTYRDVDKRIEIAYRAQQNSTGWIGWAINPTQTGMVGSQAIVAFHNSNGSMTAYPTKLNSYNPSMKPANGLDFQVSNISAEYSNPSNEMTIFAVVGPLPLNNTLTVNHIWQAGISVLNNIPQMHLTSGPNVLSTGKLDFSSV